jgi:hypothetical protein
MAVGILDSKGILGDEDALHVGRAFADVVEMGVGHELRDRIL